MAEKKQRSLRARFLSAQKRDEKKRPGNKPYVPESYGRNAAELFPKDHEELLRSAARLEEDIRDRVIMMERVSTTANETWANRWRSDAGPVIERTLSAASEVADPYQLMQLVGYKKFHEICRRKDIDVQVSLKKVDRSFIRRHEPWAVVIDLSQPYSASPDAGFFDALLKKEKKRGKAPGRRK